MVVLVMVPFEVITNSCSRNYRSKSLPTQPRTDAASTLTTSDHDDNGGEPGRRCRAAAGAEPRWPYINALPPNLLRTRRPIRSIGSQVLDATDSLQALEVLRPGAPRAFQ